MMTHSLTYKKVCRTAEQADKECTILHVLQTSPLRHLVPKPVDVQQDPLILEMLYIEGIVPVLGDMGLQFFGQLGIALQQLHHFRSCSAFGLFDASLGIPFRFVTFGDFLDTQIEKWTLWHRAEPGSYLDAYVTWLRHELDQLRSYFSSVEPIFCHGDIDTKNMILRGGELVSLIDWEHAGAYCLSWELRKFSRILQYDWQWQQLFSVYIDSTTMDQRALMRAIRYLDAADLLGHLRWCFMRDLHSQKAKTLQQMCAYFNPNKVN